MKLPKVVFIALLFLLFSQIVFSQTTPKNKIVAPVNSLAARTSAAYAEVLLQKTELLAELESLLIEYTEDYPKVRELRFEISLLQKELDLLSAINPAEASKLSTALGKLMVRKCALDTDVWSLLKQFNDSNPDVKRAKRKAEIFEAAINEILQPLK
jgi:predicted nuclease with TOPRIM domain